MKKEKWIKLTILTSMLLSAVWYVGYVFNASEPTYIDNPDRTYEVHKDDYVVITFVDGRCEHGLVIQVDTTSYIYSNAATVRLSDGEIHQLTIDKVRKSQAFRIIGKGTFYHRVNNMIGWNICMTTAILCIGICILLLVFIFHIGYYLIFDEKYSSY